MKNTKGKPLIKGKFLLKKIPGKGGWTYTELPGVRVDPRAPFGWRRVKGSIDHVQFQAYHLMPMGNGELFLPVKSEIRKILRKKEGDFVHVELYPDPIPNEISPELKEALETDLKAKIFFENLPIEIQQKWIAWIYSSKNENQKIERVAKWLEMMNSGIQQLNLKHHNKTINKK